MPSSPGTVSKILWHFTGGPTWNVVANRQEQKPKPAEEAYIALRGIISSRELRIGGYKEIVQFESIWFQMISQGSFVLDRNRRMPRIIESFPVVCVADIPVMHLNYHAERYGKLAIGFHRESVIKHGFSPVFYQLVGADTLETIHSIYSLGNTLADATKNTTRTQDEIGYFRDANENWIPAEDPYIKSAEFLQTKLQEFLAFVKSFKKDELDSIYCEREWRSIKAFKFAFADVSMVVLPRDGGYLERFAAEAQVIGIPRTVPIVAWEDLVEH